MHIVLVCGGRHFDVERALYGALDALHAARPFDVLVEGGARGADKLAGEWAASRGVDLVIYPSNWVKYGPAGGVRRNARMLAHARPDLVVGFPGGPGTADMLRRAREAGVEVIEPLRATTQQRRIA